jgi:hypothetical protein
MTSKERPPLQGERLVLRAPRDSDKSDRFASGRNPEFRKMLGGDPHDCPPLTEAAVEQWYIRLCQEPVQWIIEYEGRCIGEVRLPLGRSRKSKRTVRHWYFRPGLLESRSRNRSNPIGLAVCFRGIEASPRRPACACFQQTGDCLLRKMRLRSRRSNARKRPYRRRVAKRRVDERTLARIQKLEPMTRLSGWTIPFLLTAQRHGVSRQRSE